MKKIVFVAAALVLAACSSGETAKDAAPAAAAPAAAAPAPAADTGMKMDTSKKADTSAMKAPAKKP